MKQNLEIEVKFFLDEIGPVKEAILDLGGISLGRFFELNLLFDDKHASLFKKKSLLRLRKDQKNRLTVKTLPDVVDKRFKTLTELEIEVDDFEQANTLLNALGFYEMQRYEKWRETFMIENTQLLIDTMPYGDFLEIEGEKSDILQLTPKIGMTWEKRILANYLEIFETLKEKLDLNFNDVTFDLFPPISKDMSDIIRSFRQPWKS
jgi:adenylate cyclase class 2